MKNLKRLTDHQKFIIHKKEHNFRLLFSVRENIFQLFTLSC